MTFQNSVGAAPLTKLLPPQLAADTLPRPHLLAELHRAATSKRLVLLSAPVGAGKTTALAALRAAYPDLPMAWAALDEGDDEPQLFLQLLIAAVQRLVPEFGREVAEILQNAQAAALLRLAGALVNDMSAYIEGPFLLVLDDLHRLSDGTIHKILDYVLERMPANVHVLVTTRHDPPLRLSQLRARGQMAEFRLQALRFSDDEVAALFNDVLDLGLSAEDLEMVRERTEGWAAGMRLLSLSLPRLTSPQQRSGLIRHLSQSHRFLFDYLIDEVLSQLDEDTRTFLLQTSILEELTPPLCEAVSGREDAAALLDSLYRQNLFLILGETADPFAEPSYRYHALFGQFLRKQLRQQAGADVVELHLRAAAAETVPERRIGHLFAAEAWDEAVAAVVAIGRAQCEREFVRQQIIAWIDRIPDTARRRAYWLDLIESTYLRQKGQLSESWRLAKETLPVAQAEGDTRAELEALWNLCIFATEQPEPEWRARFEALTQEHPELVSPARQAFYLAGQAWMALNSYDWALARERCQAYLQAVSALAETQAYYVTSQHIGVQWFFVDGGLNLLRQFDREVMERVGEGDGLLQAGPYLRRAWDQFFQGDVDAAEALARRAGRIYRLLGSFAFMDLGVDWLLLMIMLARAEYERLEAFVNEAETRLQKIETHRRSLVYYWFVLWRAHWLRDRMDEARGVAARFRAALGAQTIESSPTVALMEGWEAYAGGRTVEAEERLVEARRRHERQRWVGTWGNAGVDLALFYLLEKRPQEALAAWRVAAAEMEQRDMPGQTLFSGRKTIPLLKLAVEKDAYADIAQVSLDAFAVEAEVRPIPIPGSGESLTPVEVEVLRLLMEGASNKAIAEALVITTRTVKAHVSHILQKLEVSSRTEAVARAHDLNLL